MIASWIKRKNKPFSAHYSKNFKLAYPVMISQLGHTLVALSDSIIMGKNGAISLAAVALGNSAFSLILIIGIGISYGLTPLIAQSSGKSDIAMGGTLLKNSLLVNLITGTLLLGTGLVVMNFIGRLGQSPEVVAQAKIFIFYLALSIFPLMIFLGFKQFAEGLGFTRQAMNISILGNIFNICLGIILVFGLLGNPKMGIQGIGISTFLDRLLMSISMGLFVFFSPHFKKYIHFLKSSPFSMDLVKKILSIGIPVALQYVFEVSAFAGAAIMIGWIGPIPLAAHQIAISLAAITYMMASGISSAATIHSGNYWGAEDFKELRNSAIGSYQMVVFFMILCALIFFLLRNYLPRFYIQDERVIQSAASLILVAGFFQLFDGLQVVGLGILRGMSDMKIPTLITFFSYWVIGLPSGYLLNLYFHWGAVGIWIGLSLGLMTASILILLRFFNKIHGFRMK